MLKKTTFFLLILLLILVVPFKKTSASLRLNSQGQLTYGSVLGDDDKEDDEEDDEDEDDDRDDDDRDRGRDEDEEENEDEEDEDDDREEDKDDDDEEENEDKEDEYQYRYENGDSKVEYRYKEDDDDEKNEVRYRYENNGSKVEYRYENEEGRLREEIRSRATESTGTTNPFQQARQARELEFEQEGGKLKLKVKDENGGEYELEIEDEEGFEIEEHNDKSKVKVKLENNRFRFERNRAAALTDLPLTVNSETNELQITTPNGTKTVAVLPDQAIQNLLRLNVIDTVEQEEPDTPKVDTFVVTPGEVQNSDTSEDAEQEIELVQDNGKIVYKVKGYSNKEMFGLFPVEIAKEVTVDAETGEVVNIQTSMINRILSIFAF